MIKSNKNYLLIFFNTFAISWLCAIFYLDKNEFDIEFREKAITTAKIFNFSTRKVIEEYDDGRSVYASDIDYVEYSYSVAGKNFKYASENFNKELSVGDKIEIEYVKSNPKSSRLFGVKRYRFNFFLRNLLMVSIYSFLITLVAFYAFDIINKKDTGWQH